MSLSLNPCLNCNAIHDADQKEGEWLGYHYVNRHAV